MQTLHFPPFFAPPIRSPTQNAEVEGRTPFSNVTLDVIDLKKNLWYGCEDGWSRHDGTKFSSALEAIGKRLLERENGWKPLL